MNSRATEQELIDTIRSLNNDAKLGEIVAALSTLNTSKSLSDIVDALVEINKSLKSTPDYITKLDEVITTLKSQQETKSGTVPTPVPIPTKQTNKKLYMDVNMGRLDKQIVNLNIPQDLNVEMHVRG